MQETKTIARGLMEFLDQSPVNFYAALTVANRLDAAGYERLDPTQAWDIRPGRFLVFASQGIVTIN